MFFVSFSGYRYWDDYEFVTSWKYLNPDAFKVGTAYSTIWCEHHRCPRDVFAKSLVSKKSGKSASAKEKTKKVFEKLKIGSSKPPKPFPFLPEDKLQFEQGARDALGFRRGEHEVSQSWMVSRFFVGERAISDLESPKNEPVYERFFYDLLCRHCLRLNLRDQRRPKIVPTKTWTDEYIRRHGCDCSWAAEFKESGCGTCGVYTVKFTAIDTFDSTVEKPKSGVRKQTYPFYLATDCKIETLGGVRRPDKVKHRRKQVDEYIRWKDIAGRNNGFRPADEHDGDHEIQRIVPRLPDMAEKHLAIVRGESFTVLPAPRRVGITDLPYCVLKRILVYVLGEDGEGVMGEEGLAPCLRAGYPFFKAWYWEDAASSAVEFMKQEVRQTNRGYYF
ncbi:hypothetical protein TWF718_009231 [Orbilia javanica]|uniref:Uncharacterized protein n=1 Tax=Orbilia javanica TaxID=47235 RepID=A0AAN8MVQ8_9PEZI